MTGQLSPTLVEKLQNMRKIVGGTRVGNNLFHSFEEFSVSKGMEAIFENATDIENIFVYITGIDISFLDGLVQAAGSANFFLVNPNGIVFGDNTYLDTGGSFIATTADRVEFADGKVLKVNSNQKPILTKKPPIGLGLEGNNGSIIVNGQGNEIEFESPVKSIKFKNKPSGLCVRLGQTLGLVGNRIDLNGGVITTQGGRIYLTSIKSGLVDISQSVNKIILFNNNVTRFQDINLNQQSLVDNSSKQLGTVFLNGKNIRILDASFILSQNQGNSSDGSININASESLSLKNKISNICSNIRSETFGMEKGLDINISTRKLLLQDGARIRTNSFSDSPKGIGGDININVCDSIELCTSSIIATTFAEANSGNINLSTSQLRLHNAGISSSTFGAGNGGNLIINSDFIDIKGSSGTDRASIASTSFSNGNTGDLTLNTKQLVVRDGASLSSSSFGNGNAGNLTLKASESVEVSGITKTSNFSNNPQSTIRSAVQSVSPRARQAFKLPEVPSGDGGKLIINTRSLIVKDQAVITVENQGTGSIGELQINGKTVNLDESASITATSSAYLNHKI